MPRNRRKTDDITDAELQDTIFIRRLLVDKIAGIEDRLDNKCNSCRNTWVIRFVWIAIIVLGLWIKAIQDCQATPKDQVIKAVAGEAIKAITGASGK